MVEIRRLATAPVLHQKGLIPTSPIEPYFVSALQPPCAVRLTVRHFLTLLDVILHSGEGGSTRLCMSTRRGHASIGGQRSHRITFIVCMFSLDSAAALCLAWYSLSVHSRTTPHRNDTIRYFIMLRCSKALQVLVPDPVRSVSPGPVNAPRHNRGE